MASGYQVVDEGHVGGGEEFPSEWKTIRAVFHNFTDLLSYTNSRADSPVLTCHGSEWQIQLYPGGHNNSSKEDVFIALRLSSRSCTNTNEIKANSRFRVPSAGKAAGGGQFRLYSREGMSWGESNYAKRDDVLDSSKNYLPDGNLTVEVDIQVMLDKPPAWTPTNTVCSDMLKLLDDTDNADVLFDIAQGNDSNGQAETQTPHTFYAHRNILSVRCPALAELAEDCDPDTPIPIGDVQVGVFKMLLRYVYGGEVPSKDVIEDKAKDVIRAADKYGLTGLKLAAEAEVAAAVITTENAAELILFADATNCALLKEMAMEFFVKYSQAVMASEGFEQVAESPAVMREMMAAMASGIKKRLALPDANDEIDCKWMSVSMLRKQLDEKGLDVDGSKQMLVSRLEHAEAEARTQAYFAEARGEAQAQAQAQAQAELEN